MNQRNHWNIWPFWVVLGHIGTFMAVKRVACRFQTALSEMGWIILPPIIVAAAVNTSVYSPKQTTTWSLSLHSHSSHVPKPFLASGNSIVQRSTPTGWHRFTGGPFFVYNINSPYGWLTFHLCHSNIFFWFERSIFHDPCMKIETLDLTQNAMFVVVVAVVVVVVVILGKISKSFQVR